MFLVFKSFVVKNKGVLSSKLNRIDALSYSLFMHSNPEAIFLNSWL